MRFGEKLASEHIPAYRVFYIDYEALKGVLALEERCATLRELLSGGATAAQADSHAATFLVMLEKEVKKVNDFVVAKTGSLHSSLSHLREQARSGLDPRVCEEEASTLATELVHIDRFIHQNRTGFRKIVKKFDKVTHERAAIWLAARLPTEPFAQVKMDPLLLLLADVIEAKRAREAQTAVEATAPPSAGATEFRRNTTKYWVAAEDRVELMTRLMRHLTLVRRGNTPASAEAARQQPEDGLTPLTTCVSSVYFDSARFSSYQTRLLREEGARAHRLRWYGTLDPADSEAVYVERKTHHEAWTGAGGSVKARMPLAPADVVPFLSDAAAGFDVGAACAASVAAGRLPRADAGAATELGREVRATLLGEGGQQGEGQAGAPGGGGERHAPKVRTVYRRCAYQDATGGVRVTVDNDMGLLRERPALAASPPKLADEEDAGAAAGGGRARGWCTSLTDRTSAADLRRFPHVILEVKLLQGGAYGDGGLPTWLEAIVADGLARPVPKFSKFLCGVAAFHRAELSALPDWMADPSLAAVLEPPPPAPAPTPPAAAPGMPGMPAPDVAPPTSTIAAAAAAASLAAPSAMMAVRSAGATVAPAEPITATAVLATPATAVSAPRRKLGAPRYTPLGRGLTVQKVRTVDRTQRRPDPKVFFANERTFIQWLSAGMMMVSVGIALMELTRANLVAQRLSEAVHQTQQAQQEDGFNGVAGVDVHGELPETADTDVSAPSSSASNGTADDYLAGILICSLAVIVMLYGLVTYVRRIQKINRRDTTGYDDPYGPPMLVLAVIFAIVVYVSITISGD